jgi:hypothetical protein
MAMIAMTTRSSISVKALFLWPGSSLSFALELALIFGRRGSAALPPLGRALLPQRPNFKYL